MDFTYVSLGLALAAVLVGLAQLWATRRSRRHAEAPTTFDDLRRALARERGALTHAARDEVGAATEDVLALEGWTPARPLELERVELVWQERPPPIDDARTRAARALGDIGGSSSGRTPLSQLLSGRDPDVYDGRAYRLLHADVGTSSGQLTFGPSSYYESLDTTEVLAYEYLASRDPARRRRPAYRTWLRNPFDLDRRAGVPGVCALTVRKDGTASSFLLLERDGKVSMGNEMIHVVPSGEFQPADQSLAPGEGDLDLWRTFQREFAEEILGVEDARGKRGRRMDYTEEPYALLDRLRSTGALTIWFLGVGLDPLTWKPEILLACVIEAEAFDRLTADRVDASDEGLLLVGASRGIEFEEQVVRGYLEDVRVLPAARACLRRTWDHREQLGLS